MTNSSNIFALPPKIELMLATLSKLYGRELKARLQSIVVNGLIHIEEGATYDNWNDGYHGHNLTLALCWTSAKWDCIGNKEIRLV